LEVFVFEALVFEDLLLAAAFFLVVFFADEDSFALAMGVFRGQGKPVSVVFGQRALLTLKKYSAVER
jgi:hypothetical protein